MKDSLRILLTSIVDYAGLFPPAALDLPTTLTKWRQHITGPNAWMLGRLIIPAAKLGEFTTLLEREGCVPREGDDPWLVSCLASENLDADIDRIFEFNRRFSPTLPSYPAQTLPESPEAVFDDPVHDVGVTGGVMIDSVEVKAASALQIDHAMRVIPEQLEPYIEIPVSGPADVRGLITALTGTGARAKIRTGGVTPEAFPMPRDVAKFLRACAAADLAFKATAGLHHPVRATYPLTYEPGCPTGVMFGFLNVFIAAALARQSAGRDTDNDLAAVLEESNPAAFVFDDDGITWRDRRIDNARIARVRESFATSFGSCSFDEPIADLTALGLWTP